MGLRLSQPLTQAFRKPSVKPRLPWSAALRIAWREMRAARAKFVFVILAVAVGVGALTGVRSFSRSFRRMLLREARTLMAGDLSARIFGLPTPEQEAVLNGLGRRGVERTWITETLTMASSEASPDPLLISVKAVDPNAYPYYGAVRLWEASTGNTIAIYYGHTNGVFAVAWSPDNTRIVSAGKDRTVQIWGATSGSTLRTYNHSEQVEGVAWSPTSGEVASASDDSTVKVWGAS